MTGHAKDRYYKIHGYPPSHKGGGQNRRYANMAQTEDEKNSDVMMNATFTLA